MKLPFELRNEKLPSSDRFSSELSNGPRANRNNIRRNRPVRIYRQTTCETWLEPVIFKSQQ